ncbi:methylamine utilization protein MauE [Streptomyces sp. NBC_01142]|uniref:MauE/DoxX family redox-associated membrane protein n=1 Tax=Streptomyces sp. NBC_01142 TaxID=2975865 RepID=UPI00224F727F|nr:MauE/DoxX family redox-associated membrane protein [Streptomyces sp. NBC_01142]MCX4822353.1 methylamine utilization protein MauE [Streptomyces sp. NBC_01142]
MTYLVFACRILLIGVFLVAVVGKFRGRAAFEEFAKSIADLRLLSRRLSTAAAAAVAVTELAVLALLAVPPTAPAGFALAAVLLLVFTTGIALALRRGRRAPCRCFGASAAPLGPVHVVRNLILALAGAAGLGLSLTEGAGAWWPEHVGGTAVALTTAAIGVLLVVRLDDLMALFATPPAMSHE